MTAIGYSRNIVLICSRSFTLNLCQIILEQRWKTVSQD